MSKLQMFLAGLLLGMLVGRFYQLSHSSSSIQSPPLHYMKELR